MFAQRSIATIDLVESNLMNATSAVNQMFGQIISTYWWIIPLLLFFVFLKTPFMKGVFGKLIVSI